MCRQILSATRALPWRRWRRRPVCSRSADYGHPACPRWMCWAILCTKPLPPVLAFSRLPRFLAHYGPRTHGADTGAGTKRKLGVDRLAGLRRLAAYAADQRVARRAGRLVGARRFTGNAVRFSGREYVLIRPA